MTKQDDEKKAEGSTELSLDELEGAAGGVIVDNQAGRYVTRDEFNGDIYYIGDSLADARETAERVGVSTMVMTKSEYERRTGKRR